MQQEKPTKVSRLQVLQVAMLAAGVVEAIGAGVAGWKESQRVAR